jgi:serine/threonine-protein kinase RsbT
MSVVNEQLVKLGGEQDIVLARQLTRKLSAELNFSLVDQTKLVTAVSELARNTVVHGGGGKMRLQALADGTRRGLRAIFEDEGKGIPDIELALRDGYTTGTGLGLGLGGAKRLVNEFEIESKPGAGTRIRVTRWKSP